MKHFTKLVLTILLSLAAIFSSMSSMADTNSTPPESKYCLQVDVVQGHKINMSFWGTGKVWIVKGDMQHIAEVSPNNHWTGWQEYTVSGSNSWIKIYADNLKGIQVKDNGNHGDILGADFSEIPNSLRTIVMHHSGYISACLYNEMFRSLPNRTGGSVDEHFSLSENTGTSAGVQHCNTNIAKNKGWNPCIDNGPWIDYNGDGTGCPIPEGTPYITLSTIHNAATVEIKMKAAANNTTVWVETSSGNYTPVSVGTDLLSKNYNITGEALRIYGNLTEFGCYFNDNKIISLSTSGCTALTHLDCSDNAIRSLDISGCAALTYLDCSDNAIRSLDINGCAALTYLNCSDNAIRNLDISGCSALTMLYCYNNSLNNLDVSGCTNLESLGCSGNTIQSLDISGRTALEELYCNTNSLTSLDVNGCTALEELYCYTNSLTSLDVSGCTALEKLYCNTNSLTSLDVSECTNLESLWCNENTIQSLDISGCTNLKLLGCYGNPFTTQAINDIYCALPERTASDNGKIYPLNNTSDNNYNAVRNSNKQNATNKNWKVWYFDYDFGFGSLHETDIPTTGTYQCPTLNMDRYITLEVQSGQNIRLNLAADADNTLVKIKSGGQEYNITVDDDWTGDYNYTAGASTMTIYGDINKFNCSANSNKISNLDASYNTALTVLYCANNSINSLNLSGCSELTQLWCYNNSISSLNVNECLSLTQLYCHGNDFTTEGLNALYCSLPDRTGQNEGWIKPIYNAGSANYDEVIATDKQNALNKNWKVLYLGSSNNIPTTGNYVCGAGEVNMIRYITLTVVDGADIGLKLAADADNTPVRIVSGDNTYDITVSTNWTNSNNYTAGASTMTIYGNIKKFACRDNSTKLTGLDASHNTGLTELKCSDNELTNLDISDCSELKKLLCQNNGLNSLDVSNNTKLEILLCYGNPFTTNAIDALFCSLPDRNASNNGNIYILNNALDNNYNAVINSNKQNALDKNWRVVYLNYTDIPETEGNYICGAISVSGVTVIPNNATLEVNATQQLVATIAPADATNKNVTWSSSNNAIVTVNNNGLVTAVAPGNATITVKTADGNFTANCNVTVTGSPVNMNRYITLTVVNGADIGLKLAADADGTPVRIVSGNNTYDITVGTDWTNSNNYTAGASTMTIYGGINRFNCGNNSIKLTGLDVSNNTELTVLVCSSNDLTGLDVSGCEALTWLECLDNNDLGSLDISNNTALVGIVCSNNSLSSLDLSNNINLTKLDCSDNALNSLNVSNNTALTKLACYGNPFTTNAVNALFCSLPDREVADDAEIFILNNESDANRDNVLASNKQNAIDKNWAVKYNIFDFNTFDYIDIPETDNNYVCGAISVSGVTVTPNNATLEVNATQQLVATIDPADATNKSVTWSSSNDAIATVNNNGLVTAVAPGNATITVETEDGNFTANCNVTVTGSPVNMNRYITLTVQNGANIRLDLLADANNTPVKIVSGNQVYNITVGTNWTGFNNYTAGAITMTIYGNIEWFNCSDNTTKLTVLDASQNTTLTGLWCYNNSLNNLDVSGCAALTGLYCDKNQLTSLDISQNTSLRLLSCHDNPLSTNAVDALFCSLPNNEENDNAIIYILNDDSDANYDDVIASNKSNATNKHWKVWYENYDYDNNTYGDLKNTDIPSTEGNYVCGAISVSGVTVTPNNATLEVNATQQLVATIDPADATNKSVTWSSSNDAIATVNNNGLVTAVAPGNATITVETEDGNFTANCNVTVTVPPVNMNRYITLTVVNGADIGLKLAADADNTYIKIESGDQHVYYETIGTGWTRRTSYTAGTNTMTIYGNVAQFDCYGNDEKLTELDASNNTQLTSLSCSTNSITTLNVSGCSELTSFECDKNQLTNLDVSSCTKLNWILCYDNPFTTQAINELFCSLPDRLASENATIYPLNNENDDNHATIIASDKNNANNKHWNVFYFDYYDGDSHNKNIETTGNGNYVCGAGEVNMNRYITLTVQQGEDIRLNLYADADNTPIKIVSGDNTYNPTVGTSWTGYTNYTAGATTMTIYGDIKKFDCNNNRENLTALDVSKNISLIEITCNNNKISNLNVSQNGALKILKCSNNQLENLNISSCTSLILLNCSNNKLTSLDISNSHSLRMIFCYGNSFTTQAIDDIYCALPNRISGTKGKIYVLFTNDDVNSPIILSSNSRNASMKNWAVVYSIGGADISTTGSYVCGSIAVTGVSTNQSNISLIKGNTQQLVATIAPADATNQNVTWSSSNENVTTVDNNGLVTAVAPGTATITVTSEDGDYTAVCMVMVAPITPTITVSDECGYSVLTASNFSGDLLWSNGETTASITVTTAGTYSVTQTINNVTSAPTVATASPKVIPDAPIVSVENQIGQSILTAGNYSGALLWSNGATTANITVTQAGIYSVTQTINGCTSAERSGMAQPATSDVPTITVSDECGYSVLTASGYSGDLLWNTGATTASITVTTSGTYSVTQTINNVTSAPAIQTVNIRSTFSETISKTACESFEWNGTIYTQSGDYQQTLQATNGCDSVVTLKLTILQPVATTVTETACGSFEWNGTIYTQSGDYDQTFTAANGCDSVVTLNLTVWQSPQKPEITVEVDTLTATAANKYYWFLDDSPITGNMQKLVIDKSGNYSVQVESGKGCKSEVSDKIYVVFSSVENQEVCITFYPNPVTDQLTIEGLPTTGNPELKLYNVAGQLIVHKQCSNSIEKIDMSDKVSGIYLLKIVNNNVSRSVKIVKR